MTPAFNPNAGGVQRTTWKLGKYFVEQGLEVAYYSMANEGHVEVEHGVLYHAPEEGSNRNPINTHDLNQVLIRVKPDVVINQMPYEKELREVLSDNRNEQDYVLLGCLRNSLFNFKNNARDRIRQLLPQPISYFLDNSLGEAIVQWRHKQKHARGLRAIIDQHDYFILLAPPNRDELQYFVGAYRPEKVLAIPNSIPVLHPECLHKKEKIILHVGRLDIAQKRSDLLLDFWTELYDRIPDWKFEIVGDGPYYDTLRQDLERRKLPRVVLKGHQKPEPYYEKATLFMMPSAYEGFPNTLIEAQSYGCLPFAFKSYAALDWIVNDGVDAWLSEPFDTKQMADQVVKVINSDMGSEHQKSLENARRFTIDSVGSQWLELFKELTE